MENHENYTEEMRNAVNCLRSARLNARSGLPEELFMLVSTLMPVANVDLLITDEKERILLSWRDDPYFGQGWHIPGGCVRFGETMEQRIQATALSELGCEVEFDPEPITVRDVLREPRKELLNPDERGHHITVLFHCSLPKGVGIYNHGRLETEPGYLKWFSQLPDNLLSVHDSYRNDRNILEKWERKK